MLLRLKRIGAQKRLTPFCVFGTSRIRLSPPEPSTRLTTPCTSMHSTSMHPCDIHSTSMHCTFIHRSPMHSTPMHQTAMHHSPMQISRYPNTITPQERPELFCECPNTTTHRFYQFFRPFLYILLWPSLCFIRSI